MRDIFQSVARGAARYCLVPIENTLAGSVYENYDLLLAKNLHIVAEVNLRVVHNLIAFPRHHAEERSPGLLASRGAGAVRPVFRAATRRLKKIPFYDTAGSVKMLAESENPRAARPSPAAAAAEVYGARILKTHLEDHRENFTPGFCCSPKPARVPRSANKVSIVFSTRNLPGRSSSA